MCDFLFYLLSLSFCVLLLSLLLMENFLIEVQNIQEIDTMRGVMAVS